MGNLQDLKLCRAYRGWLENVNQFVDVKFWDDGQACQFQYKDHIAVGVWHTTGGIFRLKSDQHAISEHIPRPHTLDHIPKMVLVDASEQELGSDHGGKSIILSDQSAHSLNRPLPN